MNSYHIAFCNPCKNCEGSDVICSYLLTKLWEQLWLPKLRSNENCVCNALPSAIFESGEHYFQLLIPNAQSSDGGEGIRIEEKKGWLCLPDDGQHAFLEEFLKELNTVNWDDLDYSASTTGQLHNIADLLSDTCYILNIYWLSCGHTECSEMSNSIALYGALRRLHTWNNASIMFICNTESQCDVESSQTLFDELDISVINLHYNDKILIDKNILWQGSLECLKDEQNDKKEQLQDWCLAKTTCYPKACDDSESKEPHSVHKRDVLADNITIIRELPKTALPFWRIFPSRFILYHKSLLKRVLEAQESSSLDPETLREDTETLLLASIATQHKSRRVRTTEDWLDFISTESDLCNDNVQNTLSETPIETYHLVLYPEEPGILVAYFLRPQVSLSNIQTLHAVYRAIFPAALQNTENVQYEDSQERRWLQLLDSIQRFDNIYFLVKETWTNYLDVHLDASEMLKHFTRDGKPLKKELKSLLRQIEKKRRISTAKDEEKERFEMAAGVEYCQDKATAPTSGCSPKLLPKHETLSICNTPKTLAKAKLQDVKRKTSKSETSDIPVGKELARDDREAEADNDRQLEQSEQQRVKTTSRRESRKRSSKEKQNPESEKQASHVKRNPPHKDEKPKKKRRSFDGNEREKSQAINPNTKEKRSDRHKRRLARVVRRSLIKYGVDPSEEYFTTCSERLYYLCKSFLKDLKTSEGLNNEMKRLAEANVATVVEFEKRHHVKSTAGDTTSQNTTNS